MPAEDILIDLLYEGELEDIPTVSGEDRPFQMCSECAGTEGRHHFFCSFNRDFWDEETEIELCQKEIKDEENRCSSPL